VTSCNIGSVRAVLLIAILATVPCSAQDLPDPGRRLSREEQNADPEKPREPEKARTGSENPHRYDAQACENARRYYQIACKAPESRASRSMQCNEAYAMYRQSCP
jgi:hypothetical protein